MKEELMAQLMPLIEKTKDGVLKAVEVAQEQSPELIKQIMAWHFTMSIISFLVGIGFLIAACKLFKPMNKKFKDSQFGDPWFFVWIILAVIATIIMQFNLAWLKILVAPKLFLVEYISQLIK